jgi:hypothetical protein
MGWIEDANNWLVGVQTGGQGVQASSQSTDEYAAPVVVAETPIIPDTHIEPIISENQSVVVGGRDESGEYKPVSTDTSAPAKQSFVESYVADKDGSKEVTRMDYTKLADIGDRGTQDLIKSGYSAEQATALQRDKIISDLVSKGYNKEQAAESKDAKYYQNEYDKAMQSKEAVSDIYHHKALDSGLSQAPNPFEYTGDLAKMALEKSQGVSNVPGTGLIPQFKGSLVEDANIVTKAARTGEMGILENHFHQELEYWI